MPIDHALQDAFEHQRAHRGALRCSGADARRARLRGMQDSILAHVARGEEIIDLIERTGKPLAAYVLSERAGFVARVLEVTSSGGVTVDDVLPHAVEAPLRFGGVNRSGTGRYKEIHVCRELSNAKSVFVSEAQVP